MTPRARGHHRSSRPLEEPFFDDRAVKKRKRTGRAVSFRVGRSPTSPVTTPHPRPTSIDRRADAIAPPPVRPLSPPIRRPRRRFVFSTITVGRVGPRAVDRWNRRVVNLHGGPTRWETRHVIGCACMKSSLACIDVWANSAHARSRVHRGRPVASSRISSLGTPTRARRCPDEEKERLGRRPRADPPRLGCNSRSVASRDT